MKEIIINPNNITSQLDAQQLTIWAAAVVLTWSMRPPSLAVLDDQSKKMVKKYLILKHEIFLTCCNYPKCSVDWLQAQCLVVCARVTNAKVSSGYHRRCFLKPSCHSLMTTSHHHQQHACSLHTDCHFHSPAASIDDAAVLQHLAVPWYFDSEKKKKKKRKRKQILPEIQMNLVSIGVQENLSPLLARAHHLGSSTNIPLEHCDALMLSLFQELCRTLYEHVEAYLLGHLHKMSVQSFAVDSAET